MSEVDELLSTTLNRQIQAERALVDGIATRSAAHPPRTAGRFSPDRAAAAAPAHPGVRRLHRGDHPETHRRAGHRLGSPVLVPGSGPRTATTMADKQLTDWLRRVHPTTRWTTSVCTGAMILAAAGILDGLPATTHWIVQPGLAAMGAKPRRGERVVQAGKVVTAAGVSAGIDLGLWLAGEVAGRERAETIQLYIEYDPRPPFDAGHPSKASRTVVDHASALGRRVALNPSEMRAVPTVAWRRALDKFRKRRGSS